MSYCFQHAGCTFVVFFLFLFLYMWMIVVPDKHLTNHLKGDFNPGQLSQYMNILVTT